MSNFFVYMVGNNLHPFLRFKRIFFWLAAAGGNWGKSAKRYTCRSVLGPGWQKPTLTEVFKRWAGEPGPGLKYTYCTLVCFVNHFEPVG